MQKNLVKVRPCGFRAMQVDNEQTDRQTDRRTHHSMSHGRIRTPSVQKTSCNDLSMKCHTVEDCQYLHCASISSGLCVTWYCYNPMYSRGKCLVAWRYSRLLWRHPLMHKVAKMVTQNNGVRRHTGLTHGF